MINRKFLIYSILSAALVALAGIGGYLFVSLENNGIYHYLDDRDRSAVLEIFDKNRFWLVAESSNENRYSAEYMLDNRSRGIGQESNLNLFVYRVHDKTVGFLAYYRTMLRGYILFLVVDDEYRGKGYARKLLQKGINDLKDDGVTSIELLTRLINTRARGLYESSGFNEFWRNEDFIRYEYTVA